MLVPGNELAAVSRAAQVVICATVSMAYVPSLYQAVTERKPTQQQQLLLGIVAAFAGATINGGVFLLWRTAGKPEWLLNSPINGLSIWLMVFGALLHLTSPRTQLGEFPRGTWLWLVGSSVLVLVLSFYLLASPQSARDLAEWLRLYLM